MREQGKPIPDNDLWVVALCLEAGSTLVSFDRHFGHVDGLRVWLYEDARQDVEQGKWRNKISDRRMGTGKVCRR